MVKPIICLDFDGVIHSYTSGWQGAHVIPDPVVPGAIDFITKLIPYATPAVFSSRTGQPLGLEAMRLYVFTELCVHYHEQLVGGGKDPPLNAVRAFNEISWPLTKPPALATIDDRAITFTGEWPNISDLINFKPWNKK